MRKRRKTAPRPKWQRGGARIRSIGEFQHARTDGSVVYVGHRFRGRPITVRWVANMAFGQVLRMIDSGCIELAVPTPRYQAWLDSAPEATQ